jgi:hypothetical protein
MVTISALYLVSIRKWIVLIDTIIPRSCSAKTLNCHTSEQGQSKIVVSARLRGAYTI